MDEHISTRTASPPTELDTGEHVHRGIPRTIGRDLLGARTPGWPPSPWHAAWAILWGIGNEHVWTGAVGGLFAICSARAFNLSSDETKNRWTDTEPPAFWWHVLVL